MSKTIFVDELRWKVRENLVQTCAFSWTEEHVVGFEDADFLKMAELIFLIGNDSREAIDYQFRRVGHIIGKERIQIALLPIIRGLRNCDIIRKTRMFLQGNHKAMCRANFPRRNIKA